MNRPAFVAVLIVLMATNGCDRFREESAPLDIRLDREYRAMRHRAHTSPLPALNDIVEYPGDWVEVSKRAGLQPVSEASGDCGVEVYRVTFDRTLQGRVTIITAVLGDHPEVRLLDVAAGTIVSQKSMPMSFEAKMGIRDLMAQARFWDLEFYSGWSATDGTVLVLEGAVNGRYRRISETNFKQGFLHTICTNLSELCGIAVPSDE